MKKLFFSAVMALTAIFTLSPQALAQKKIDRDSIRAAATPQIYASLLKRFEAGEELSTPDATILYFASALQPGFNPAKKYTEINETYSAGATDNAFRLCRQALAADPTNLTLLFKAYASAAVSKDPEIKAEAPAMQARLLAICDAIFDSGQGVTDASPYIIIRPSDLDEFLIKYIQPEKTIGRAKINNLDAIKVNLNGIADDVILYFAPF